MPAATRTGTYHAGRGGRAGVATPASRTARMPVRKMPSNVPAPPIEATGAPRPVILSRFMRSAPISVPIEPLDYIGGSMGTLIGADLMNLDKITGLGAPVASIGGAGTFDGIFLTGILAVLLAGVASPSRPPRPAW